MESAILPPAGSERHPVDGRLCRSDRERCDAISGMTQPPGVAPEYAASHELSQAIEFLDSKTVVETRQARLRSQVPTFDQIAFQEQFVDRIPGLSSRVGGVQVAAGDQEHKQRRLLAQTVPRGVQKVMNEVPLGELRIGCDCKRLGLLGVAPEERIWQSLVLMALT
jgi:hypothetical protein